MYEYTNFSKRIYIELEDFFFGRSPTIERETTLIVTSTVSPPKVCEKENYVWLTKLVAKDFLSYTASSSKGSSHKPENSVLMDKSTKDVLNLKNWQPQYLDKKQWFVGRFLLCF